MKKLLAIIFILLIIFLWMYFSKANINEDNITVAEVTKIEEYISKIYMWQDITDEALPKFRNINEASELWIWEVVKKNLEQYELTYDEIQQKAIEIFGNKFNKKFPLEGSKYILFNEQNGKYLISGIGLDTLEDMFLIKGIEKNNNIYSVEIVEYLEDYSEADIVDENEQIDEYDIYIKNLNNEIVTTIKNTDSENRRIEIVKEKIDKFSTKKVKLINESGNLYVESVE